MVYWIIGAVIVALIGFCYFSNNYIVITRYHINLGADTPFRIVQLSDLHSKQYGVKNARLHQKVAKLQPDMIAFTGDLIDDSGKNIEDTIGFLGGLTRLAPVYYIFGNHEHRTPYLDEIADRLTSLGVHVLKNEITKTQIKGNALTILGMDENQAAKKNYKERKRGTFVFEDNSLYLKEFEKQDGIKLLLSHFPENFDCKDGYGYRYSQHNYDLQLSGHAHGGQFRLPFIGGVFAPGQGINPRFYQGIHGNRPYMIVSRGLANSSFPLRLFNCPELVAIEIS